MTKIMGILNITPDSFSDGGKFLETRQAIARFEKMVSEGADIIDIGAQSTRPGAEMVSAEQEWVRLEPVLKEIKLSGHKTDISVDSFNPEVIKNALSYDISMINDVSGFQSDEMRELAAHSGKKIIFMHNVSIPADKNKILPEGIDIMSYLTEWLEKKISELENAGIKKHNMIFDPGIGFGKSAIQSFEIIMNADKFKNFGIEVLIGHSEKSFLKLFTNKPAGERNNETKMFTRILAYKKIDYIRVHDVAGNKQIVDKVNAVQRV